MYGLRLPDKIELGQIVQMIKGHISDYYWVFENEVMVKQTDDQDRIDKFFQRMRDPQQTRGLISDNADLIKGDWDNFCGAPTIPPKGIAFSKQLVEDWAQIYFSCIDAAFWEVYAKDKGLLEKIKSGFPGSSMPTYNGLKLAIQKGK